MQTRSERGSTYRGVSKNGSKWNMMVIHGDVKKYIGKIWQELLAARLYDKYTLILKGLEAKINFSYTRRQIEEILQANDGQDYSDPNSIAALFANGQDTNQQQSHQPHQPSTTFLTQVQDKNSNASISMIAPQRAPYQPSDAF